MHYSEALQWFERNLTYGLHRPCDRAHGREALKTLYRIVHEYEELKKREENHAAKRPESVRKGPGS